MAAVSYTHLDVYKRQGLVYGREEARTSDKMIDNIWMRYQEIHGNVMVETQEGLVYGREETLSLIHIS